MSSLPDDYEQALARTTSLQNLAANPAASVWVSANAGTGKTHVLTNRVLRLLLTGTRPDKILCLTFTKAAAAQMATRVFDKLAQWVTAEENELEQRLRVLLERPATPEELVLARHLFALAIETPGGLKIQTIHAFCERLLQRFPLEAGVPPGFKILDETLGSTLKREAIDRTIARAAAPDAGELHDALMRVIRHAAEDRFDTVIEAAMGKRAVLADLMIQVSLEERDGADGLEVLDRDLRDLLGLADTETIESVRTAQASVLSRQDTRRLIGLLQEGGKSDKSLADSLAQADRCWDSEAARIEALEAVFLTGTRTQRTRLGTNKVKAEDPAIFERLAEAQTRFCALEDKRVALQCIEATISLYRLASEVMQDFTIAKRRRGVLDYDDLIWKTGSLLKTSESAEWVLFKLDGGLDHILVDESQDTSPDQWRIIDALAREFFSGEGAREEARTIFAVGDEKQSIYSFQGAAPEMFRQKGGEFERLAKAANRKWEPVPLTRSFRTVAPVLEAVDQTFAEPGRTPGLLSQAGKAIHHEAHRIGQAGRVEIWETEKSSDAVDGDAWQVLDAQGDQPPAVRLADRIADRIAQWLADRRQLPSKGRPVQPSDIMILVRKRTAFARPMVAALKARGIPVAGADRMDLMEQIAVQDLMALAEFLVLPEDDLSLACLLKSPLIGFDDDDLFALGHGRASTLWRSLLAHRQTSERYSAASEKLIGWRRQADFLPPYEFFAHVLDRDGGRRALLDRLGSEAADPLDEFLNAAIAFDDTAPPSMSGFLAAMQSGSHDIKRDMEQGSNEVRVLTVHGAKGLEAPIVFLPDTCSTRGAGAAANPIVELASQPAASRHQKERLPLWAVKDAKRLEPVAAARKEQASRDTEERNRLLYVAMTRAEDELIVTGFEGKSGRDNGCWYDLIQEAVAPISEEVTDADGRPVLVLACDQSLPVTPADHGATSDAGMPELPVWARSPAPKVLQPTVPLAPSRLAPYDHDEEGEPVSQRGEASAPDKDQGVDWPQAQKQARDEPAAASPIVTEALDGGEAGASGPAGAAGSAPPDRFLRGTATHALLQYLPGLPLSRRREAAEAYLQTSAAQLDERTRQSVIAECLAILDDTAFGNVFGRGSRAEVAIAADIPDPQGRGPSLRLSGQIDRLVIGDDEILIVDYKTNRTVPRNVDEVAEVYLLQLAAYRLTMSAIHPAKTVRSALLWTFGPSLLEIPEEVLISRTSKLWELQGIGLDAPGGRT